jgi:hypothetical protein
MSNELPAGSPTAASQPASGSLAHPPPLLHPPGFSGLLADFLHEEAVTLERLLQLFRQAYMPVEVIKGPALRGRSDNHVDVDLYLGAERKQITIACWFLLNPDRELFDQLLLANAINDGVAFVRAAVRPPKHLMFDSTLALDGGIPTVQIIEGLRRLVRTSLGAIRQFDKSGLVR